jgi:hypothetical protein
MIGQMDASGAISLDRVCTCRMCNHDFARDCVVYMLHKRYPLDGSRWHDETE